MFSIALHGTEGAAGAGTIRLGAFSEAFEAAFGYWSPRQYREHWRRALGRLLTWKHRSALITSLTDPEAANSITWWPMYREGDGVIVQQQVLFLDQLDGPFTAANYLEHLPRRERMSDAGEPISEWRISLAEISSFLNANQRIELGNNGPSWLCGLGGAMAEH